MKNVLKKQIDFYIYIKYIIQWYKIINQSINYSIT